MKKISTPSDKSVLKKKPKADLRPGRVLIVLFLFAATGLLLQMTDGVTRVPIATSLSQFPKQIGGYHLSRSLQSSSEVLELLGVDDYIQYNYVDTAGSRINLYVGYYEAVGVSGSYHSPKNCLPGGGWGIDSVREVTLDTEVYGGGSPVVSQMMIRSGERFQVVMYWYQNRGRIIASEYMEKIYLVVDALMKRRRDGTFVRIMTATPDGNTGAAEARVKAFAEQVMVELEQYLPGEGL